MAPVEIVLTVLCSVLSATGLWTFLQRKMDRKDGKTNMLIGLGHDRIITLGMEYVNRGWLTQDEYENLRVYLYEPYSKIGGNGSAERVMKEVEKLPIK